LIKTISDEIKTFPESLKGRAIIES